MRTLLLRRALSTRPRRSALYLPGSNARALQKAQTLAADVLILDCEDAVAPENKALARQQIQQALSPQYRAAYGHRELVVRVNSLASEWGREDVHACAAAVARGCVCGVPRPPTHAVQMAITAASIPFGPEQRQRLESDGFVTLPDIICASGVAALNVSRQAEIDAVTCSHLFWP